MNQFTEPSSEWFAGTTNSSGLSTIGLLPCVPGSRLGHHLPSAQTSQPRAEWWCFAMRGTVRERETWENLQEPMWGLGAQAGVG